MDMIFIPYAPPDNRKTPTPITFQRLDSRRIYAVFCQVHFQNVKSVGQSLSAFCTSSFQNFSAISGLHSFSETVFLFPLDFFRLVRSKHYEHLLYRFALWALSSHFWPPNGDAFPIICKKDVICQVFLLFFSLIIVGGPAKTGKNIAFFRSCQYNRGRK